MHAASIEAWRCTLHVVVKVAAVTRDCIAIQWSYNIMSLWSPNAYCLLDNTMRFQGCVTIQWSCMLLLVKECGVARLAKEALEVAKEEAEAARTLVATTKEVAEARAARAAQAAQAAQQQAREARAAAKAADEEVRPLSHQTSQIPGESPVVELCACPLEASDGDSSLAISGLRQDE